MNVDDLNATIRKLQAEDGDLIVLTCEQRITVEAMEHLHERLTTVVDSLGVQAKVLVLDAGMDIKVIHTSQLQPADPEPPLAA